jgi:hypothetical protein
VTLTPSGSVLAIGYWLLGGPWTTDHWVLEAISVTRHFNQYFNHSSFPGRAAYQQGNWPLKNVLLYAKLKMARRAGRWRKPVLIPRWPIARFAGLVALTYENHNQPVLRSQPPRISLWSVVLVRALSTYGWIGQ